MMPDFAIGLPQAVERHQRHDRPSEEKQQGRRVRGVAAFHPVAEETAQNPGREPKMFHAALICPDMMCCWPMAAVNPFCALETNRKDVPSSKEATRSD
jgi:hypothetical protein